MMHILLEEVCQWEGSGQYMRYSLLEEAWQYYHVTCMGSVAMVSHDGVNQSRENWEH